MYFDWSQIFYSPSEKRKLNNVRAFLLYMRGSVFSYAAVDDAYAVKMAEEHYNCYGYSKESLREAIATTMVTAYNELHALGHKLLHTEHGRYVWVSPDDSKNVPDDLSLTDLPSLLSIRDRGQYRTPFYDYAKGTPKDKEELYLLNEVALRLTDNNQIEIIELYSEEKFEAYQKDLHYETLETFDNEPDPVDEINFLEEEIFNVQASNSYMLRRYNPRIYAAQEKTMPVLLEGCPETEPFERLESPMYEHYSCWI